MLFCFYTYGFCSFSTDNMEILRKYINNKINNNNEKKKKKSASYSRDAAAQIAHLTAKL